METNADKAFDLAYFILGDRVSALKVTTCALRLCSSSVLHKRRKRLEYGLKGRFIEGRWMKPFRTKFTPNALQELQSLVYAESARHEVTQEQVNEGRTLADEDFIVRYIKHLVYLTTIRSSFYVSLGLNRLLFDYTTRGAMDIYETVMQDVERQKAERYYGKQRLLLMKRLKERFGQRLQTRNHPGKEMNFVKRTESERWFPLIEEALGMFTPWETCCVLPVGFQSVDNPIPRLAFSGSHPDKEHAIEALRMHALLHLPCFRRLTAASRLAAPKKALSLPQFFSVGNGDGQPRGCRGGGGLLPDEREAIRKSLQEAEKRRKSVSPEFVIVKVDGIERCRVDLNGAPASSLEVDDAAGLMEIVSEDEAGEATLAVLLFASQNLPPIGRTKAYFISLTKGRKLRVDLTSRGDEFGEYSGSRLTFEYRENAWAALLSRLGSQRSNLLGLLAMPWTWGRVGPLAVSLAVALALVSVGLFLAGRHTRQPTNVVARVESSFPPPNTVPPGTVESGAKNKEQNPADDALHPGVAPTSRGGRPPVKRARELKTAEGTRSFSPANRKELSTLKRIYVEEHPGTVTDGLMRATLIRELSAAGRFVVADDPEQADGFLLWSLSRAFKNGNTSYQPPGKLGPTARLSISLTNKEQRVLWKGATEAGRESPTEEALVKDLLSKLQSAASN